jgi:chromosome segregation ATPase
MSQDNELRRLEQFVEKLLGRFSELRSEKAKLLQELRERELLIENLRNNLSSKDMERSEISQRVSKIVEQIEAWEMGLGEAVDISPEPDSPEEPKTVENIEVLKEVSLPVIDEGPAQHRVEEEGRVQHNLFSLGNTQR